MGSAAGSTAVTCGGGVVALVPAWSPADVDAPRLWAESGAQWLTAPGAAVPVDLVRAVTGIVAYLDRHGAELAATAGAQGVGVLAERAALLGLGPASVTSCGGVTRLLRCADDWIAVSLARRDDIDSIPAWLGADDGDDPWSAVRSAAAGRPARDLVEQGVALGVACSIVGEQSDTRPVLLTARGDAAPRALDGAVVVNLASLWAGPFAADAVARMGARVINVESTSRADGARHTPAFFEMLHGRSESVGLELHTETGRHQLAQLLDAADVVIEGSRPRALAQMGIDADAVVGSGPKVWLSITAYGRHGTNAHRIGFGDDAAAAGALVGRIDGVPTFLADAVADPITGLTAAATIAQLLATPGRWMVDVALSRVAASMAPPFDGRIDSDQLPGAGRVRFDAMPPRARRDRGGVLPLGRDTRRVLAEFGIGARAPRASSFRTAGARVPSS